MKQKFITSETISQRISNKMVELKLNQKQLSTKCGWGNSARISNYIRNSRSVSIEDAAIIAKALNVNPGWLAFGEGNPDLAQIKITLQGPVTICSNGIVYEKN